MTETEKALNYYRSAFEGIRPDFLPSRVRLLKRVKADALLFGKDDTGCYADAGEHPCKSNHFGALSVKAANGQMLGVKPGEFEVAAWRSA